MGNGLLPGYINVGFSNIMLPNIPVIVSVGKLISEYTEHPGDIIFYRADIKAGATECLTLTKICVFIDSIKQRSDHRLQ